MRLERRGLLLRCAGLAAGAVSLYVLYKSLLSREDETEEADEAEEAAQSEPPEKPLHGQHRPLRRAEAPPLSSGFTARERRPSFTLTDEQGSEHGSLADVRSTRTSRPACHRLLA